MKPLFIRINENFQVGSFSVLPLMIACLYFYGKATVESCVLNSYSVNRQNKSAGI